MRILLLGGSGRIGKRLAENLTGYDVVSPSKSDLDLSKTNKLDFGQYSPDLIVNAAGITDRAHAARSYLLTEKVNVLAVAEMASYCEKNHIPLIHLSSGDIYSWGDRAATERDPTCQHASDYEKSKFRAELQILRNMHSNYWMLRLGYVWTWEGLHDLSKLGCNELLIENRIFSPISAYLVAILVGEIIGRIQDPCANPGIYNLSCRGLTSLIGFLQFWDNLGEEGVIYSPYLNPPTLKPAVFPGSGLSVEKFEREFGRSMPFWESEFYEIRQKINSIIV